MNVTQGEVKFFDKVETVGGEGGGREESSQKSIMGEVLYGCFLELHNTGNLINYI